VGSTLRLETARGLVVACTEVPFLDESSVVSKVMARAFGPGVNRLVGHNRGFSVLLRER
jgi:hypothetical protein